MGTLSAVRNMLFSNPSCRSRGWCFLWYYSDAADIQRDQCNFVSRHRPPRKPVFHPTRINKTPSCDRCFYAVVFLFGSEKKNPIKSGINYLKQVYFGVLQTPWAPSASVLVLRFAKADGVWFHTSPAGFGQQLPYHEGQDHKSKQSARSLAKTKVVMERGEKPVCVCVCVCVCVLRCIEQARSLCAHLCLCPCTMQSFCDDLAGSAACSGSAFPLWWRRVWSAVSPRKTLRGKQVIGEVSGCDRPACEGQAVKFGKAEEKSLRLFSHMSPHFKCIQMCTKHMWHPTAISVRTREWIYTVYSHCATRDAAT